MTRIRDQINETRWWSSSAQTRDDIDPQWLWGGGLENLSQTPYHERLHVLSVHCAETFGSRGYRTVRVILECEEGVYYRDSSTLVGQIQHLLNWFGPVEEWPPVCISRPDQSYPRYEIIPQF